MEDWSRTSYQDNSRGSTPGGKPGAAKDPLAQTVRKPLKSVNAGASSDGPKTPSVRERLEARRLAADMDREEEEPVTEVSSYTALLCFA